jgi:hypothetical protein
MPPKWIHESGVLKMTTGVAQSFLRGTRRIVSVKFYVSPNSIEGGYMKQQHAYKEISNPDTHFGAAKNWDLFHKSARKPSGRNPAYLTFPIDPHAHGLRMHSGSAMGQESEIGAKWRSQCGQREIRFVPEAGDSADLCTRSSLTEELKARPRRSGQAPKPQSGAP